MTQKREISLMYKCRLWLLLEKYVHACLLFLLW